MNNHSANEADVLMFYFMFNVHGYYTLKRNKHALSVLGFIFNL